MGGRVVPQSQAVPLIRVCANSSVATSFPSRVATTSLPTSNDGVIDFSHSPPTNLVIVPFGQNANDQTFTMRVIGWKQSGILYIPIELWEGTITLGASQGTGSWIASTTIASGSNNVTLPASTIKLVSASGFAASGFVTVLTSNGPQIVQYGNIVGNQLQNCVGANGSQGNGQVSGTMSTGGAVSQYGIPGGPGSALAMPVTSSDFFADTITTTIGDNGVDCQPLSPANDQIAHLMVDLKGCPFVEVLFSNGGGTAVQMNALVGAL